MNAKKAWIFWILACLVFAAVVWAFAHGASQEETGAKVAWMGGAIVVAVLGVFLSWKLRVGK